MIVRLYESPGCGLCEEAHAALLRLARGGALAIVRVDVTAEPALLERFALRVPVLAAGGSELDAAGLGERAIERWLRAVPHDGA